MGHYASEMDPDWGKPRASEVKLAEVEDDRVRNLAKALFKGFDLGSHLENSNTEAGIQAALAIDELVRARVEEALGGPSGSPEA